MFRLIESICTKPIRFIGDKSINFNLGMIVQLTEIDKNVCCTLSDGSRPFGVVERVDDKNGLVSIWFDSMVFRTDNFEISDNYKSGNALFVSKNGKLSTEKPFTNAIMIGHIISIFENNTIIEVNWI